MTVKSRIVRIRLSEKISRNMEYAENIGIYIVNRETDTTDENAHENRGEEFSEKK